MATKKKSFDAVKESRRWRIATGRKLRGLTFDQQQELLNRPTEKFFAEKAAHRVRTLAPRKTPFTKDTNPDGVH